MRGGGQEEGEEGEEEEKVGQWHNIRNDESRWDFLEWHAAAKATSLAVQFRLGRPITALITNWPIQ